MSYATARSVTLVGVAGQLVPVQAEPVAGRPAASSCSGRTAAAWSRPATGCSPRSPTPACPFRRTGDGQPPAVQRPPARLGHGPGHDGGDPGHRRPGRPDRARRGGAGGRAGPGRRRPPGPWRPADGGHRRRCRPHHGGRAVGQRARGAARDRRTGRPRRLPPAVRALGERRRTAARTAAGRRAVPGRRQCVGRGPGRPACRHVEGPAGAGGGRDRRASSRAGRAARQRHDDARAAVAVPAARPRRAGRAGGHGGALGGRAAAARHGTGAPATVSGAAPQRVVGGAVRRRSPRVVSRVGQPGPPRRVPPGPGPRVRSSGVGRAGPPRGRRPGHARRSRPHGDVSRAGPDGPQRTPVPVRATSSWRALRRLHPPGPGSLPTADVRAVAAHRHPPATEPAGPARHGRSRWRVVGRGRRASGPRQTDRREPVGGPGLPRQRRGAPGRAAHRCVPAADPRHRHTAAPAPGRLIRRGRHDRILRVAWSVSDRHEADRPDQDHITAAIDLYVDRQP